MKIKAFLKKAFLSIALLATIATTASLTSPTKSQADYNGAGSGANHASGNVDWLGDASRTALLFYVADDNGYPMVVVNKGSESEYDIASINKIPSGYKAVAALAYLVTGDSGNKWLGDLNSDFVKVGTDHLDIKNSTDQFLAPKKIRDKTTTKASDRKNTAGTKFMELIENSVLISTSKFVQPVKSQNGFASNAASIKDWLTSKNSNGDIVWKYNTANALKTGLMNAGLIKDKAVSIAAETLMKINTRGGGAHLILEPVGGASIYHNGNNTPVVRHYLATASNFLLKAEEECVTDIRGDFIKTALPTYVTIAKSELGFFAPTHKAGTPITSKQVNATNNGKMAGFGMTIIDDNSTKQGVIHTYWKNTPGKPETPTSGKNNGGSNHIVKVYATVDAKDDKVSNVSIDYVFSKETYKVTTETIISTEGGYEIAGIVESPDYEKQTKKKIKKGDSAFFVVPKKDTSINKKGTVRGCKVKNSDNDKDKIIKFGTDYKDYATGTKTITGDGKDNNRLNIRHSAKTGNTLYIMYVKGGTGATTTPTPPTGDHVTVDLGELSESVIARRFKLSNYELHGTVSGEEVNSIKDFKLKTVFGAAPDNYDCPGHHGIEDEVSCVEYKVTYCKQKDFKLSNKKSLLDKNNRLPYSTYKKIKEIYNDNKDNNGAGLTGDKRIKYEAYKKFFVDDTVTGRELMGSLAEGTKELSQKGCMVEVADSDNNDADNYGVTKNNEIVVEKSLMCQHGIVSTDDDDNYYNNDEADVKGDYTCDGTKGTCDGVYEVEHKKGCENKKKKITKIKTSTEDRDTYKTCKDNGCTLKSGTEQYKISKYPNIQD